MSKLETYRIDHPLFEGIEFDCPEKARNSAMKLVEFLIRVAGESEANVCTLVFMEESGVREWFHHDTIEGRLEISGSL